MFDYSEMLEHSDLNTSHVKVNHEQVKSFTPTIIGFKYISC